MPSGPPALGAEPSHAGALGGGSFTLDVRANGQSPLQYQLVFNRQALPGETNFSFTVAHATATNAGQYAVAVHNSLGAVTSRWAQVTVLQPAIFKINSLTSSGSLVVDHDSITG